MRGYSFGDGLMKKLTVNEIGQAFEDWTYDVLRPYINKLGATNWTGNPDFYFDLNNHVVLIECKCYRFRTPQKRDGSKPAYLSLRQSQINSLRKMKQGLGGENEIYFIIGITFGHYDMVPFVVELEEALKHAKRWSDKQKRKWIPMEWIIKQKPLRKWMGEMFKVEEETIVYPEFRAYLRK